MKTTVALGAVLALGVSVALGWYQGAAYVFLAYVAWTFIRIPIARRQRMRAVGDTMPRGWHPTEDHEEDQ